MKITKEKNHILKVIILTSATSGGKKIPRVNVCGKNK
jgi:hypothetical protein